MDKLPNGIFVIEHKSKGGKFNVFSVLLAEKSDIENKKLLPIMIKENPRFLDKKNADNQVNLFKDAFVKVMGKIPEFGIVEMKLEE